MIPNSFSVTKISELTTVGFIIDAVSIRSTHTSRRNKCMHVWTRVYPAFMRVRRNGSATGQRSQLQTFLVAFQNYIRRKRDRVQPVHFIVHAPSVHSSRSPTYTASISLSVQKYFSFSSASEHMRVDFLLSPPFSRSRCVTFRAAELGQLLPQLANRVPRSPLSSHFSFFFSNKRPNRVQIKKKETRIINSNLNI